MEENALWDYAPEGIGQEDVEGLTHGGGYAAFWNSVLGFLSRALSLGLADGAKLLAKLCGILLSGAIFRSMEDPARNGSLQAAFKFLLLMVLTLTVQNALEDTLILVNDTMNGVCSFLMASLPVSGLLLAMNGEVERATLQGVSLQHVIAVFSAINTQFLAPVLRFLLALTLAGSVAGDGVGGLTAFIARFLKRSILFLFTLLSAILALQNALAAAADSVAMRGVRFAAGSFIPVVGNLVGEASRTLAAGIDLVKKECGVACILILAYLLARPMILLAVQKLILSASGAVGGILGDKACVGFLRGIVSVWDLMLAMLAFQACYFMFSIVLFLGGGGSL